MIYVLVYTAVLVLRFNVLKYRLLWCFIKVVLKPVVWPTFTSS